MTSFEDDELSLALLEAWWPDGIPDEEVMLAGRLSTEMRDLVAKRLRAVLGWKGKFDFGPKGVTAAAAQAQVSKPRFYAMAQAYLMNPSISELGVRAAEKRTRTARVASDVRAAVVKIIEEAYSEDPDASVTSIVRRLSAADVPSVSYSMVRRLSAEVKRAAPLGLFGGELVFDSAGLDAVADGRRIRLHLLFDGGTGLVLGSAVATNPMRARGFEEAADDALASLGNRDLSSLAAATGQPRVVINLQMNPAGVGGQLQRDLRAAGVCCVSNDTAAGRTAIRILGERLGSVWLGAGERDDDVSYRNGRKARMPEFTAEFGHVLRASIEDHNARRLAVTGPAPSAADVLEEARTSVRHVISVVRASIAKTDASLSD